MLRPSLKRIGVQNAVCDCGAWGADCAKDFHKLSSRGHACAHTKPGASPSADAVSEAALVALDDMWVAAEIGHDRATLERILDDRFLSTFASGKTIDRNAYIDWILSAEIKPFKVVHDVIRIHGDTALVVDLLETGGTKITWVAVKRAGRWRVISQTFSRAEPR